MQRKIDSTLLSSEIKFQTSRSSGPGGQNVNKTNTKVTLRFDLANSFILTEEEKQILLLKLANRLTAYGELILNAQEKRSQLQNKEEVVKKFDTLMAKAFAKKKARKATKPSKTAVQKRIQNKKQHSEKKKWRQKPE
jgi:ribosome-associated protein